eukprot:7290330-Pyramimonas_sp.AAC.1
MHGTRWNAFEGIMRHGLSCRSEHNSKKRGTGRSRIHFAPTVRRRSVNSGWDPDPNVIIFVDWHEALQDGIKFCWSDNGVLLSEANN